MAYFLAFTAAVALPLAYDVARGRLAVVTPRNGFLAYLYLQVGVSWLVMRALAGRVAFTEAFVGSVDANYDRVFLLATVGVLCFHASYALGARAGLALRPPFEIRASPRRVAWVTAAIFVAGLGSFALLVQSGGGLAQFVESRQTWRSEGVAGSGPMLFPATTGLILASLVFVVSRSAGRNPRALPGSLAVLLLGLLPSVVIGFRSAMLLPVLQAYIVIHACYGGIRARAQVLVAAAVMAAFTAYGVYRQWDEVVPDAIAFREGVSLMLESRPELFLDVLVRSKGAEAVWVVMREVDRSGDHQYFLPGLVEAATILVPRTLWRDKPPGMVVAFSERFFGVSGGASPTALGELYWHLGWLGVALGMAALGLLAWLLESFRDALPGGSPWLVLYSFAFVAFVMSAEAIQNYLNGFVLVTLAFLALAWVLTVPIRTAEGDGNGSARPGRVL
jgi:hypothetical protein